MKPVPASNAPLIALHAITKDFPGVRALDDVSFAVHAGEIHALVGENGAGKSTLIKILGGIWPASSYQGEMTVDGQPCSFSSVLDAEGAGIAVIYQELALVPELTVAENIYLGNEPTTCGVLNRAKMLSGAQRLLDELQIPLNPQTRVADLGIGHRQMVEIAKALSRDFRILVLDEPSAALSEREVEILLELVQSLRNRGKGIIYISHRLNEIHAIADTITVLRDGKSVAALTPPVTDQELIRCMVGRDMTQLFPPVERTPGDVALAVSELAVTDASSGRAILSGINLELRAGEVVGVAGLVGAGRTELLETLFGIAPGKVSGEIHLSGRKTHIHSPRDAVRHGIALVSEDRRGSGLVPIHSVLRNMTLASLKQISPMGLVDTQAEQRATQQQLTALKVKTPSAETIIGTLSGGNQQKVVIGKWLLTQPRILLLDEPTRGIDVGAKYEIYELINALAAEGMAILLVSSELPELLGLSDRIYALSNGIITGEFSGPEQNQESIMTAMTKAFVASADHHG